MRYIDNSSTNATCPPQTNSQSSGSRSRYGRHRDIGRGSGLRRQVEKIVREAETSFGDPDRDRNSFGAPDRDRSSLGSPDRDRSSLGAPDRERSERIKSQDGINLQAPRHLEMMKLKTALKDRGLSIYEVC